MNFLQKKTMYLTFASIFDRKCDFLSDVWFFFSGFGKKCGRMCGSVYALVDGVLFAKGGQNTLSEESFWVHHSESVWWNFLRALQNFVSPNSYAARQNEINLAALFSFALALQNFLQALPDFLQAVCVFVCCRAVFRAKCQRKVL